MRFMVALRKSLIPQVRIKMKEFDNWCWVTVSEKVFYRDQHKLLHAEGVMSAIRRLEEAGAL